MKDSDEVGKRRPDVRPDNFPARVGPPFHKKSTQNQFGNALPLRRRSWSHCHVFVTSFSGATLSAAPHLLTDRLLPHIIIITQPSRSVASHHTNTQLGHRYSAPPPTRGGVSSSPLHDATAAAIDATLRRIRGGGVGAGCSSM